jgi:methylated-DNA-[protein]-cysteine S-methyltransferase
MNVHDDPLTTLLSTPDAGTMDRLHENLVRAAGDAGLLDVAYRTMDSPVGGLLIAVTPIGLVRVAYTRDGDDDDVLSDLAARVSPRILQAPDRLDAVARELDEYFGRRRRDFDVALDLRLAHGYRREVLHRLRTIGYGRTASYTEVARATSSPTAVRAVGSACRTNPLPVVIPCHRVVRSDGTAGQYVGGADAKRTLLALEAG